MSHLVNFQSHLQSAGVLAKDGLIRAPSANRAGWLSTITILAQQLWEYLRSKVAENITEEEVRELAVGAYRNYVRPINIPWVDDFVLEPALDNAMEAQIVPDIVRLGWSTFIAK